MDCRIPDEKLWSWIDRSAPELEDHLNTCSRCRARVAEMREDIDLIARNVTAPVIPMPESIGRYRITRLIGEGGQALVYQAEQQAPRRPIALKVLKGGRFAGKDRLRRFLRETQILARLKHPAIAAIYETGHTEEGQHYFAMELVEGLPLDQYSRTRPPTRKQCLELFLKVCDAVRYAHRHNVIHRDLKPSNILVDELGNPHILDFGLARITRADLPLATMITRPGLIEGTPRYMSPEQTGAYGGKIDARTDVYSLGVILYELMTGSPPYRIDHLTEETSRTIRQLLPVRPGNLVRDLRGDVEAIIMKALEKDPARRYGSAADMESDIRRYLNSDPVRARSVGRFYILRKMMFKRRRLLASLAIPVVVVGWLAVQLMRPAYDIRRARLAALDLKCELLAHPRDSRLESRVQILVSRYADLPESILLRAHGQFLFHEPRIAIEVLENALKRDPGRRDCLQLLAEIFARQGVEQDLPGLDAPAGDPTAESDYRSLFATLDLGTARQRAETALAREPDHVLALAAASRLAYLSGDFAESLNHVRRLIDRDGPTFSRVRLKGSLMLAMGQYEDALLVWNDLADLSPSGPDAHFMRGQTYRVLGRYQEAVDEFTAAIPLFSSQRRAAWTFFNRATPLWILGRREQAVADYITASRLLTHATFGDARSFLILQELGRSGDAARVMARARDSSDNDPWLARVLACLDGDLAPDDLVRESRTPTQECEGCYYAGEVCLRNGDVAAAVAWFRRCLDTGIVFDPQEPSNPMSERELACWRLRNLTRGECSDPHTDSRSK